jgi:hypothetical protein
MDQALALEEIALFPIRSERFPDGRAAVVPTIVCGDGYAMSVQASVDHHCTPQDDDGPWIEFEVSADNSETMLAPYWADEISESQSIYTNVPIDILRKIIDKHEGIVINGKTYTYIGQSQSIKSKLSAYLMRPSVLEFTQVQEFLRSCNHIDKKCGMIQCHHCSYFKSALTGGERMREGRRAFCPFTAATHKSIVSVSNDNDRAEIIGELLDLLDNSPEEITVEKL